MSDRATEIEEAGRWYFKRDILKRLDRYFSILRAVKSFDENYYAMCANVGAVLAPTNQAQSLDAFAESDAILALPSDQRLAFGCVVFKKDVQMRDGDEKRAAEMAIIAKHHNSRVTTEAYNGDVYAFSLVFHFDDFHYVAGEIPIAILPDGGLMILRQYIPRNQVLPRQRRGINRGARQSLTSAAWAFSPHIYHIADQWKVEIDYVMQRILTWFQQVYAIAYFSQADTRIAISKKGLTAAFSVDLMRLPYFFADRDVEGNRPRKSIFHIVRTHVRRGGAIVHSHFRGNRVFQWHGFEVRITMPGTHHSLLSDWTAALQEEEDVMRQGKKAITMTAASRFISRSLRV